MWRISEMQRWYYGCDQCWYLDFEGLENKGNKRKLASLETFHADPVKWPVWGPWDLPKWRLETPGESTHCCNQRCCCCQNISLSFYCFIVNVSLLILYKSFKLKVTWGGNQNQDTSAQEVARSEQDWISHYNIRSNYSAIGPKEICTWKDGQQHHMKRIMPGKALSFTRSTETAALCYIGSR